MSYRTRQPKWYRNDGIVQSINKESEEIKVGSYHDFERRYVKQPMQIWCKFKPKTYTFMGTNTIPIDITGSYPAMFNFTFTAENDITDDIVISDGTNTITIFTEVPAGYTFELSPQGRVKIDGKEIRHIYDQEQSITDRDIPFGVINGNRKLMQIFSPDSPDLIGIEIQFSRIIGAQDGLTIELYELNADAELHIKINEYYLTNENLRKNPSGLFNIVIPFIETLDITKQYAFVIKRRSAHSDTTYFVLRGTEDTNGTLKYWDGDKWITSSEILYFKTLSPVISGTLPIINPPIGEIITNIPDEITLVSENLELDKIYARSTALPVYPLQKMSIYLDDGTLLKTKEFKLKQHQYCYMMIITAEELNLLDISIEKLPFKVYLETEWYYFEHSIKRGFPQLSLDEDSKYWPNEKLDLLAERYQLFRRKYREDILPYEYIDTSPIGYPFTEEQDYMLEKRILDEYPTRSDVKKTAHLYDEIGQNKLVELKSKIPGVNNIEIYTYNLETEIYESNYSCLDGSGNLSTPSFIVVSLINPNDEIIINQAVPTENSLGNYSYGYQFSLDAMDGNWIFKWEIAKDSGLVTVYESVNIDGSIVGNRVNITLTTREKEIITEDYLFIDSIKFMDKINDISQILSAKYLNNATSLLLYNIEYINTEGVYPTYGLISAEIHSYLGVIPTIKDMVDYCLVYDRKTWNNFLWSGDIYSPAVFRVDIPKPPSNFSWLTHDEIKAIIKRCKKVGTEVISAYSTEVKVGLNLLLDIDPPETIITRDFNLGIGLEIGDALVNLPIPLNVEITEMEVIQNFDVAFNISLETQVSLISELFSQTTNTEFTVNNFKGTKINGSGSEAYIDLDNSTISDTGYKHATVAQNLPRVDGTLGWTNLSTIAIDGQYIIGETNTTGSGKATRLLSTSGFAHNIPSDAFVTGIKVLISADSSQPGGSTAYCTLRAGEYTSEEKSASAPQGWNQITFGGSTAMWELNARGSDINGNNLKVELYFDTVGNNQRIQVDWVNVEIYWRNGSGSFTTERIVLV